METILITGAGPNGVTGKRIKEKLQDNYLILSPSSKELNLIDATAVDRYFDNHRIDYVIHSALTSPSRGHDSTLIEDEVESNLRMYFNLARHSDDFKKMFFFGSGAEFDKSQEIKEIKEEEYMTRMPRDKYGFVKYILNNHAVKSDNIYNLRLFGTINPYEPYTRNVISNLCAKATCRKPLNLRRDCIFSFIDVDDIAAFIHYGIANKLLFHDYNMASRMYRLKEIAEIINDSFCDGRNTITFEIEGFNREYTACNQRLRHEFTGFTPLQDSITKVFAYQKNHSKNINIDMIDTRWKPSNNVGGCN